MVATSRHDGMLALRGAQDGLHGAFFYLWTANTRYHHHHSNTTHLDPTPSLQALVVVGDLSS